MKKAAIAVLALTLVFTALAGCAGSSAPAESNAPANTDFSGSIAVYTREESSGTRGAFVELTGVGEDMYPEAVTNTDTNAILTSIEENRHAISYVSLGAVTPGVKIVKVDGVQPSTATIKDGSFAIQRPFIVCVNAESAEKELVKDFIGFMMSAEGQALSATKWLAADDNAPAYAGGGLSGTITVGGSTSVDPLMVELVAAYKAHNPGVDIPMTGGGSGTGISEAASGVLDIGMSSRDLKDEELASLTPYVIARDGVVVVVNPENPLENLTIAQIKAIFTGEVTDWANVK
ncbi:MAG: extracellular solute-binding protein [Oscillospiraceae bacterium]|jgi:phosphate transport system substrate-binding protein|nr:extracellular solute-binding protein [Oscillospiraceae bacterium]